MVCCPLPLPIPTILPILRAMKEAYFDGAGGPDVIRFRDATPPEPERFQVRVQVAASALNRADLLQRRGGYPAPPGWPADVPGLEFAGTVESSGEGVTRWQVGDQVMGLVGGGAHAEFLVADEAELLPVPPRMELRDAAAIPEAFLTAYDALYTRARLEPGERLLIHAIGSGVGTAALQLAKQTGASVIGTSRSAGKLKRAAELGMDQGIDTGTAAFRDEIEEPVNVVLDALGAPALADNMEVLAVRGRLIVIGFLQGSEANTDLQALLRKRLEVIGTVMRSREHEERAALVRRFADDVLPSLWSGALSPVIDRYYPMDEMATAHGALERSEVFGKIVMTW